MAEYLSVARYKRWQGLYTKDGQQCGGIWLREICLMSANDLHLIPARPELFLNKIFLKTDHTAYQCMEYLHYERMRREYLGTLTFDTTFYENLEFVSKHI